MSTNFKIRPATSQDATDIAYVNHETWVATYRGILDESAIKAHSLEEQVALWRHHLGVSSPSETRFVADVNGMIVGYSGGGRNPEIGSPFESELFGIYVLKDYQGRGIGKALTQTLAAWLKEKGHRSMLVWVLRENPYRNFYAKLGGSLLDQSREIDYSGKNLNVVCYGWSDLSKLC